MDQTPENELQMLPQMITSWKKIQEEMKTLREQTRERNTRRKALEEVILRIMKKNNIGALDLKQSNSRLMYKKRQSKETLNTKTLTNLLSEHLKSEEAAKSAVNHIMEKRGVKMVETLTFEQL